MPPGDSFCQTTSAVCQTFRLLIFQEAQRGKTFYGTSLFSSPLPCSFKSTRVGFSNIHPTLYVVSPG